jgi:hypothetical protein
MPKDNINVPDWVHEDNIEQQTIKIKQKIQIIQKLQSNADLLIKHYRENQSIIGWLAEKQNKQSWAYKCTEFVAVTAIALSISTIGQIGSLCGILLYSMYFTATILLSNHASTQTKEEQLLRADILALEQDLNNSIEKLRQLEQHLAEIIQELHHQHDVVSEQSNILALNIANLTQKINLFEHETQKLITTQLAITKQLPEIFGHMQTTLIAMQETNNNLFHESKQLSITNNEIQQTTLKLQEVTKILCNQSVEFSALLNSQSNQIPLNKAQQQLEKHQQEKAIRFNKCENLLAKAAKKLTQKHNLQIICHGL